MDLQQHLTSLFANKTVVYLDLEYIHETLKQKCRPNHANWKEVVQFGAVKFDHREGREVEKYSCLVRPNVFTGLMDDEAWLNFQV